MIQFGIFTGDIVISGTEKNWDEIDKDILDLNMDIYFSPGNHDLTNKTLYESRYGSTYYSFTYNSDLFIILDPNIDGWNISGDQLEFLENELSFHSPLVDNIFVFSHQLLWWDGNNFLANVEPNSTEGRNTNINFWSEIEPLFKDLPNNVHMFAGDLGANKKKESYMYHSYSNITFVASGMGAGKRDNIISIDVAKDKSISYNLISLNGSNIHKLGELEDYVIP